MQIARDEFEIQPEVKEYPAEPEYVFHDPAYEVRIFGFTNTGAICWWNSLVQTMLSLTPINKALIRAKHNLFTNKFACAYINLIEGSMATQQLTPPSDCLQLLNELNTFLVGRRHLALTQGQQCADEGFTLFIEALGCPEVENICRSVYEYKIKCTACDNITTLHRDHAMRIDMFTPAVAVNMSQFCAAIQRQVSYVDRFVCPICKHVQLNVEKLETLKVLREVVVITFDKFRAKVNRYFPAELVFPSFGKRLRYQLVGKIEHSGNMHGGHYWTHVRRNDTIHCINDTYTSTGSFVPTAQTFMVAYVLIDHS